MSDRLKDIADASPYELLFSGHGFFYLTLHSKREEFGLSNGDLDE